jgi:hypothetical protein
MTFFRIYCLLAITVLIGIAVVHRLIWGKSKPIRNLSIWHIDSGDALTFGQAIKTLVVFLIAFLVFCGIMALEDHFFPNQH